MPVVCVWHRVLCCRLTFRWDVQLASPKHFSVFLGSWTSKNPALISQITSRCAFPSAAMLIFCAQVTYSYSLLIFRPGLHVAQVEEVLSRATSEGLTPVLVKIQVFWDVTPFISVSSYRRFEQPATFHPRRINHRLPRRQTSVTTYQSQRCHIPEDLSLPLAKPFSNEKPTLITNYKPTKYVSSCCLIYQIIRQQKSRKTVITVSFRTPPNALTIHSMRRNPIHPVNHNFTQGRVYESRWTKFQYKSNYKRSKPRSFSLLLLAPEEAPDRMSHVAGYVKNRRRETRCAINNTWE
jgi:hypothetical protein